jgi:tetratricopeptide (TPR) repeat protein
VNPERLFLAGLSAYRRGDRVAAAHYCEHALHDSAPGDALTVRLSHLYLVSTELWWNSTTPTQQIGILVDRAVNAAERTGDLALRAMAACARARYLIATDGLPAAVAVFSEAAELAAASGKVVAELEALADLGHHTVGLDMARGLAVLQRAQILAERNIYAAPYDVPLVQVQRARVPGLIGVAAFDDGRFGEAETSLRRSVAELDALCAWDQFALICNYLGQLLTEMGRFAEGEDVLLAALVRLRSHADLSTFQGYNLGLLAKLYLEWGRIDAAQEAIMAGWERLLSTRHRAILPILRNYLGELIMHPSYPHRDIRRARDLFAETIAECQQTGFQRSEIAAISLHALADLDTGRPRDALAASARAVERLAAAGTMPALRTEEIYMVRYKVLHATGAEAEAAGWLARAGHTLALKAATIPSARLREQFLSGTPTSREIMSATADTP